MRIVIITMIGLAAFVFFIDCKGKRESSMNVKDDSLSVAQKLFDPLLCNGFDFPIGTADGKGPYTSLKDGKKYDGFYVATKTGEEYALGIHTGEDWNGTGGGNSDEGLKVFATAKGKVLAAKNFGKPWGNIVMVEHHFIENGFHKKVFSLYAHLNEIKIQKDDTVKRRQLIGTVGTGNGSYPAHLHFEIRKASMQNYDVDYWPSSNNKDRKWVLVNYEQPSDFVNEHRTTPSPVTEETLLVAVKHNFKMYLYAKGTGVKTYPIALSQEPVRHKQKQGDNRLPEGAYTIIEKNRGPFSGDYASYFGPAWMRISYPNNFDAQNGFAKKLITAGEMKNIIRCNNIGLTPPKNTALGGGIGIHGWSGEWSESGKRALTWGCISMHNRDLDTFYDLIPAGTPIIILP